MSDIVNNPPHYTQGHVECIDAIESSLTREEFIGFLKGNAMKYVWRTGLKGDDVEQIDKALWYLNKLKEFIS